MQQGTLTRAPLPKADVDIRFNLRMNDSPYRPKTKGEGYEQYPTPPLSRDLRR